MFREFGQFFWASATDVAELGHWREVATGSAHAQVASVKFPPTRRHFNEASAVGMFEFGQTDTQLQLFGKKILGAAQLANAVFTNCPSGQVGGGGGGIEQLQVASLKLPPLAKHIFATSAMG